MTKHWKGPGCAGCAYMRRHHLPERMIRADHRKETRPRRVERRPNVSVLKARNRRRKRKSKELSFFGITAKDLNMNPNRRR